MQVAVRKVKSTPENPLVVGIDLLPADPVPGAKLIQMDFTDDAAPDKLKELMGGHPADIVMSDMAANTTGLHELDHLRIMGLLEMAYDFALQVLNPGGRVYRQNFSMWHRKPIFGTNEKKFCRCQTCQTGCQPQRFIRILRCCHGL